MKEMYVWKVTFGTDKKDEDGDELGETHRIIAADFDLAYGWAKEQVGFAGIVGIMRVSDKLEVV